MEDKTQKEKIREKWKTQYPDCTTGGIKCIDCSDKDDIETFWLNELDLAIKETEERMVRKIEGIREDCRNDGGIQYLSTYDQIINLIRNK